jgi:hypothetical protein
MLSKEGGLHKMAKAKYGKYIIYFTSPPDLGKYE